jgi:IS30 family transposase
MRCDLSHSSIQRILTENGGIRPRQRKRSSLALTLAEREIISRGLATQLSMREIASRLGRSPSTVSREIQRNGGYAAYRASAAEDAAWQRALRPKACKLASRPHLVHLITEKLQDQWSPDQIAGWLKPTSVITCHTKPSTKACSFRPGEYLKKSSWRA